MLRHQAFQEVHISNNSCEVLFSSAQTSWLVSSVGLAKTQPEALFCGTVNPGCFQHHIVTDQTREFQRAFSKPFKKNSTSGDSINSAYFYRVQVASISSRIPSDVSTKRTCIGLMVLFAFSHHSLFCSSRRQFHDNFGKRSLGASRVLVHVVLRSDVHNDCFRWVVCWPARHPNWKYSDGQTHSFDLLEWRRSSHAADVMSLSQRDPLEPTCSAHLRGTAYPVRSFCVVVCWLRLSCRRGI